nr:immunoglobulin heavy chain junction region [Mus musculus]MBK4187790.1 immunoglobulin heavy chain junction region [Mus musculus]MBK4187791.1 immunoglobulin heavy chain junction region [Mus musculus]
CAVYYYVSTYWYFDVW